MLGFVNLSSIGPSSRAGFGTSFINEQTHERSSGVVHRKLRDHKVSYAG